MITALIRPAEWELPLLLHIAGSIVLVGALVLALTALAATWRGGSPALTRAGYRALLWAALPGWIVMRVSAQWLLDEEGLADEPPGWVDIGFMASEPTLLLIVAATVMAGIGARREPAPAAGPAVRDRVATVFIAVSLLAYVVAIWAMTTKPV